MMAQKTRETAVRQVYKNKTTLYQILYVDERIVLLRSNTERRDGGNVHRIETRGDFERGRDEGLWELQPDSPLDMIDSDEVDWSQVDYIGAKTNANLHEAGYDTALDIRQADDDALLAVDGLGQSGLDRLREFAR